MHYTEKVEILKNHNISISKYKLWKTLHELGYKYKKGTGYDYLD